MSNLFSIIKANFDLAEDKAKFVYELREWIHKNISLVNSQPIDFVRWVPIDKVQANDYNPNSVAKVEMKLLYTSILHDGYTQPAVTIKSRGNILELDGSFISLSDEKYNLPSELWNYLENQALKSLPIQLAHLMQTDVLQLIDEQIATQLELYNQNLTEDSSGVNGSKNNGEWDLSKLQKQTGKITLDNQLFGHGTLQESTKQNSYYVVFCHTYTSNIIRPSKHWLTFVLEPTESTLGIGMILKINTSLITGKLSQTGNLQQNSTEQLTPSEPVEASLISCAVQDKSKYIIVDGFHRYFTCKSNPDILERNHGMLPIVVIDKEINDRMASTIRHNRARGKHSVAGMSSMVFSMLENGWEDKDICDELGMEAEELLRLKHITGFSKLFADQEYKMSWVTKQQILLEKKVREEEKHGSD